MSIDLNLKFLFIATLVLFFTDSAIGQEKNNGNLTRHSGKLTYGLKKQVLKEDLGNNQVSVQYFTTNSKGDTVKYKNHIIFKSINSVDVFHGNYLDKSTCCGNKYNGSGNYFYGAKIGTWKYYDDVGKIIDTINYNFQSFKNDTTFAYHEDGAVLISGKLIKEKKVGIWKTYNLQGILKSTITFKNNKLNGLSRTFNENGKIVKEENYKNDLLHNLKKTYSRNGLLNKTITYKKGKKHGLYQEFDQSSKCINEVNFKKGFKHGKSKQYTYNTDGTLSNVIYKKFKNDKLEGKVEGYDIIGENKILSLYYNYRDGKMHGICQKFKNEKKVLHEVYVDGILLNGWKYNLSNEMVITEYQIIYNPKLRKKVRRLLTKIVYFADSDIPKKVIDETIKNRRTITNYSHDGSIMSTFSFDKN